MSANVSLALRSWAERAPERCAVRTCGRRASALSFAALERRVDALAHGLAGLGLAPGERAALFVPPGPDMVALFHALLRLGAPPVLIDPGMGRRALLACLERTAPRALIGVPRVHAARLLWPRAFRSVEHAVSVGRGLGLGAVRLERLESGRARPFPVSEPDARAPAAILFTSGSTGPAKGVVYSHANFAAQIEALRALYQLEPGAVDCACFPLFALFDHALGLTSVFPELDPGRPGDCDPAAIHRAIEESGATFSFGSPAIWRRVLAWGRRGGVRFTRLSRVTIAGAPVPPALVLGLAELLPAGARVHTPYGATEALPVSDVSAGELAHVRARIEGGEGSCLGRTVPGIELALVRLTDEPLERWSDDLRVAAGEPGEICVRGALVTASYLGDEPATRAAKIPDGASSWHRMGDVGRLDADGRLWLLGRKSHRLSTEHGLVFPVPLENLFDTTPGVARSALIGVGPRGHERPHLVIEPEPGTAPAELIPRLRSRALPPGQRVDDFLFHARFPVDVRHNAKIRREDLKRWAEGLGRRR